ncbi:MAG TPA: hypothetical protein VMI56_18220 [Reyranella sp.]|nr:hypothetical protein [Reyranella sp.]
MSTRTARRFLAALRLALMRAAYRGRSHRIEAYGEWTFMALEARESCTRKAKWLGAGSHVLAGVLGSLYVLFTGFFLIWYQWRMGLHWRYPTQRRDTVDLNSPIAFVRISTLFLVMFARLFGRFLMALVVDALCIAGAVAVIFVISIVFDPGTVIDLIAIAILAAVARAVPIFALVADSYSAADWTVSWSFIRLNDYREAT